MALFKAEKKAPKGPSGRWDVVVGEDLCKACGFCLSICPVDVFAYRKAPNKIGWFPMFTAKEENCVGCMLCYQVCPDFCINVELKQDGGPDMAPIPPTLGAPRQSRGTPRHGD